MKRTFAIVSLSLAAASLGAAAKEQPNDWNPAIILMAPVCRATDWNQTGALNTHVVYVCGCDPLAWGQVITYHALNHNFPHRFWVPTPVTGTVSLPKGDGSYIPETRTTMVGPYDWAAIRDKVIEKDASGADFSHAGRLMWDLGVLGHTQYGSGGTQGTVRPEEIVSYFGYQNAGYPYTAPGDEKFENVPPYWRDMLRRILRTSLQAEAPLCNGIGGHMIVTDGWGIDENGEEWFHVDYGWGSGSGKWWNLDKAMAMFRHLYPLIHPQRLGSVVAGRVSNAGLKGIEGARVTLRNATTGQAWGTAKTDAQGLYCFTGLPLVDTETLAPPDKLITETYTLTVEAEGFAAAEANVAMEGFIDSELRGKKQDAWEEVIDKAYPFVYPIAYGGAVADFTLEPVRAVRYVVPNGTGNGTSWEAAAPLSQATLDGAKGAELRVAKGNYAFTSALTLAEGTLLKGGYDPATGARDPLATPSTLTFTAGNGWHNDPWLTLSGASVLDGFTLTLVGGAPALCKGTRVDIVRNCTFPGSQFTFAEGLTLETCLCASTTASGAAFLHCTLVGDAIPEKTGEDLGGNRFVGTWAEATAAPTAALPCAGAGAPHVCPTHGLDGRPLNGTLGALGAILAPYRLRLR